MEKITHLQFFCIIYAIILSVSSFVMPHFLLEATGRDFFIPLSVGAAVDIVIGYILTILGRRRPNDDIYGWNIAAFGPWLGRLFCICIIGIFYIIGSLILDLFGRYITIAFFLASPSYYFQIVLVGAGIYAAGKGITVISRLALGIALILGTTNLIFAAASIQNFDVKQLFPLFTTPMPDILKASMITSSWFGACTIMAVMTPYIRDWHNIILPKAAAVISATLTITVISTMSVGVFGAASASKLTFVIHTLSQMVSIGRFIKHLEGFNMMIWTAGSFISLSAIIYSIECGVKEIFMLKENKWLNSVIGASMLIGPLFAFESIFDLLNFIKNIYTYVAFMIFSIIPLLLLIFLKDAS